METNSTTTIEHLISCYLNISAGYSKLGETITKEAFQQIKKLSSKKEQDDFLKKHFIHCKILAIKIYWLYNVDLSLIQCKQYIDELFEK